ncbi:phosphodiester glycosidase family protein [Lampropedia aestuarii]|uniref:Phosphodiester glycosidase family protein n=1 Tax=Lampropedia aestuarii TaxID=2562762 RepID=A0A4S5BJP4_9BURK|nr:phosphodiester glycosidase family protein [Lampropedia aestuarii]THJ31055.1 phosphodiester glycosidase family protein [Lampropedia aestuarii]
MFKKLIGIIFFLCLSISYALESRSYEEKDHLYEANIEDNLLESENPIVPSADWSCWGWKRVAMQVRDPHSGNNDILSLSTDVCVRDDLRPLLIDVYFHEIFMSSSFDEIHYDLELSVTHKITGATQSVINSFRQTNIGNGGEYSARNSFPAIRSGDYDINVIAMKLIFRRNGLPTGEFVIQDDDSRQGTGHVAQTSTNAQLLALFEEAKSEALRLGQPSHIYFSSGYEVPMTQPGSNGGNYSSANDASLVVMPFNWQDRQFVVPHLLGDTHEGDAARCEGNPNAVTSDGTKQIAEILTVSEAWNKMSNDALLLMNANYFDTRAQGNNTTWLNNRCSTPLGMYFDNVPDGPTNGTHNEPNVLFPGPQNYIGSDGSQIPLDTLFWTTNRNTYIDLIHKGSPTDQAVEEYALDLIKAGYQFIAVSGSGLPLRATSSDPTPDTGSKDTTRIGLALSDDSNLLYIFQGGAYDNGFSRLDISNLFNALGVSRALELDGGGSASLALANNQFFLKGRSRPDSSCNISGLWCSPVTQPDGSHRPVPSWLVFKRNN